MTRLLIIVTMLLIATAAPAWAEEWAEEWTIVRGGVLELVGDAWQERRPGDTIAEAHVIRTLIGSPAWLRRDGDMVVLGADTKVQIFGAGRDGLVTIGQHFGEVTIETDANDAARRFAILTPHLAAAAAGATLTVVSDAEGSRVEVQRGAVGALSVAKLSGATVHAGQPFAAMASSRLASPVPEIVAEGAGHSPAAEASVAHAPEGVTHHAAADDHGA